MRQSEAAWEELRYVRSSGADGYDFDGNMARRAMVLWALQYDRQPADLPLLRWLVEQEAMCRRQAPLQGMTEQTRLAGFLLAEHRQVEDVWLHWSVKCANFDTWCGYDAEHLVAAGVTTTIEFVRASGHQDRDEVLEWLLDENGEPHVTDSDLEAWFAGERSWFPVDPTAEELITWVDRALLVGERDLARRYLDQWASGRERNERTLSMLSHTLAELGDFAQAAEVERDLIAFATSPFDEAGAWYSLAQLERKAGRHDAAWDAVRQCKRALESESGWERYGLGRLYVEELFRLAGEADGQLAATVFEEAERAAETVPGLPLVAFEAAAAAAERVDKPRRAEHYQAERDAERKRIDAELRRFR